MTAWRGPLLGAGLFVLAGMVAGGLLVLLVLQWRQLTLEADLGVVDLASLAVNIFLVGLVPWVFVRLTDRRSVWIPGVLDRCVKLEEHLERITQAVAATRQMPMSHAGGSELLASVKEMRRLVRGVEARLSHFGRGKQAKPTIAALGDAITTLRKAFGEGLATESYVASSETLTDVQIAAAEVERLILEIMALSE
ncbi:MAG: hypothetical protein IT379_39300 [Deltaproteobacteria bacterium]|nr:hypothetical protein [Deltaproteobacteria bacterium]